MIMPGQHLVDSIDFMFGNAAEDIGEPSLGIDLVELRCLDERIGSCRSSAASVVSVRSRPPLRLPRSFEDFRF